MLLLLFCQNLEDFHSLNAQRKTTQDDLWAEFQKETKHYKDSTEDRKIKFEVLKRKDEHSSNTISRQMRKLQKLQESIILLRHKMAATAKETEERTRSVKEVHILERFLFFSFSCLSLLVFSCCCFF